MKIIALLFSIFCLIKTDDNFNYGDRPRSIECSTDNETIKINFCNIRAISKKLVFINFGFEIMKPLKSPIYIQIIYNYRFGTIYREMINSNKIEFCELFSGKQTNPVIELFMDVLKRCVPNFIHSCPYEKG